MSRVPRRQFIKAGAFAAAGCAIASQRTYSAAASDPINIGVVGCGIRGKEHIGVFLKLPGAQITGLCDPDRQRLDEAAKLAPTARQWTDMRDMFASNEVDAVVIAACNHWHALAALWALDAGKHVYIEKPLSLTHEEGRLLVDAVKRTNHVLQVGTQQRSDPMQNEIKQFLHQGKTLGAVKWVLVNRYGVRGSIGLRDAALQPPTSVDYNLWLGPAEDAPIYRKNFHYDWHWVWNTGSGEMGNWGVHVLDDVRNVVFQDRATIPGRIVAAGDRVAWHDAGDTPNLQFVVFEAAKTPVVVSLCNLPDQPVSNASFGAAGPPTGYVAFCEGGRLEGQRGSAAAFDAAGKTLRVFRGNGGETNHRQNFLDAVRSGNAAGLNAPVDQGHWSTAWCNLTNIATQLSQGEASTPVDSAVNRFQLPALADVFNYMQQVVAKHGADGQRFHLGPLLTWDFAADKFAGDSAGPANKLLSRAYRPPFTLPATKA